MNFKADNGGEGFAHELRTNHGGTENTGKNKSNIFEQELTEKKTQKI